MALINFGVGLGPSAAIAMVPYIAFDVLAGLDEAHWTPLAWSFVLLEALTAAFALKGSYKFGAVVNALYCCAGLALLLTNEAPVVVPGVDFLASHRPRRRDGRLRPQGVPRGAEASALNLKANEEDPSSERRSAPNGKHCIPLCLHARGNEARAPAGWGARANIPYEGPPHSSQPRWLKRPMIAPNESSDTQSAMRMSQR